MPVFDISLYLSGHLWVYLLYVLLYIEKKNSFYSNRIRTLMQCIGASAKQQNTHFRQLQVQLYHVTCTQWETKYTVYYHEIILSLLCQQDNF